MTLALLDCPTGLAGNMLLAALLDLGLPLDVVEEPLAALGLAGRYKLVIEERHSAGLRGLHLEVESLEAEPAHRHWRHLREQLQQAPWPQALRQRVLAVFSLLAEAEATVHGCAPEAVHFHEVGALDALVDIVGVCAGLLHLQVSRLVCGLPPAGHGSVATAHGRLPLPAPAVLEIARRCAIPLASSEDFPAGELTTPTGLALAAIWAERFAPAPAALPQRVGVGLGSRRLDRPNLLRLTLALPCDRHGRTGLDALQGAAGMAIVAARHAAPTPLPPAASVLLPAAALPTGERSTGDQQSSDLQPSARPTGERLSGERATARRDTARRDTARRDTTRRDTAEAATAEPDPPEPGTAAVQTTETGTTEPGTTEPGTTAFQSAELETVLLQQCQIDDASGEDLAALAEALRRAGALEVFSQAITMKKGRIGVLLSALVTPEQAAELRQVWWRHSSTLGLRETLQPRWVLPRRSHAISTPLGTVRLKWADLPTGESRCKIEHDDLQALAQRHDLPLAAVRRQVESFLLQSQESCATALESDEHSSQSPEPSDSAAMLPPP